MATIIGRSADDTLLGTGVHDVIIGLAGNDSLVAEVPTTTWMGETVPTRWSQAQAMTRKRARLASMSFQGVMGMIFITPKIVETKSLRPAATGLIRFLPLSSKRSTQDLKSSF